MLFDLRGRGRRRTIQGIYLALAVLMGGGLVFFGIGGNTSGGLFDAFKGNGGGSASAGFEKQLSRAQTAVRLRPQDAAAWAQLTRVRYSVASSGENYDQNNSQFTAKGKAALRRTEQSWDRYLALDPPKPDDGIASLMLQAFGTAGLNKPDKAAEAAEIITISRPSFGAFATLARFAYQAGQTRKGDLAAQRAVDLTPKDQRKQVKQQLDALKAQGAAGAGGSTTPGASATPPSG